MRKQLPKLKIEDMQKLAKQHGGKCLSPEYTKARTKLKWQCKKGHTWDALSSNVKRGSWCPKCAKDMGLKRKLTIDEMQDLAKKRGGKCLSSNYIDTHTKLKWECKGGHIWEATPNNIKRGQWCPKCAKREIGLKRRSTIKEMQEIATQRDGKCLSSQYINDRTKLKWECKEGHIWEAIPSSIKQGRWCKKCANKENGAKKRLTIEQMQELAKQRGGKCLSAEYNNANTKLKWQCKEGHTWEATPAHVKFKTWCPICGAKEAGLKIRLTIDEMQAIARKRGGKCLSTEYMNSDTKLKWECIKGHTWEAIPSSIKKGTWCPECNVRIREIICRKVFETLFNKEFPKTRPDWLVNDRGNRMELDGFNKELFLAFEHQGEQHYGFTPPFHQTIKDFERQRINDRIKRELCKKNGIILIEIPYIIEYEQMGDFIINKCKEMNVNVPKNGKKIDYNELAYKSYTRKSKKDNFLEEFLS